MDAKYTNLLNIYNTPDSSNKPLDSSKTMELEIRIIINKDIFITLFNYLNNNNIPTSISKTVNLITNKENFTKNITIIEFINKTKNTSYMQKKTLHRPIDIKHS